MRNSFLLWRYFCDRWILVKKKKIFFKWRNDVKKGPILSRRCVPYEEGGMFVFSGKEHDKGFNGIGDGGRVTVNPILFRYAYTLNRKRNAIKKILLHENLCK